MEMFDLSGKCAVVVGAGSGIGKAIAMGYADAGADILVADYNQNSLNAVSKEIYDKGKRCFAVKTDVTNENDVQNMATQAMDQFGRIDVFVHSVGTTCRKPLLEMSTQEFEQVIRVNQVSVFTCGRIVGSIMVSQGSGSIINLASIMGHVALPGRAGYDSSKGGVVQLTKAMALDFAPHNVRVSALCPGFTKTPLTQGLWGNEKMLEFIKDRTPMGRLADPQEMVGAAIFLASDASQYVTGSSLFVDGGWMAW
jgi:NAD(P)-dependent dehydrogenase (short-subunit alcohol dehydrogenase family)